jgi:NitT/TauT family transport system substrate-binding protein
MTQFLSGSRWTRRQALWLLAGAAGGLGLHACNQSAKTASNASAADSPANLIPAAFGVTTWIGNSALYIAQEKKFFREAGLDLTVRTYGTVAEGFPAFSAGQLQGVLPVTSEAVSLAAKGVDCRIVMVADTSAGADVILARNSITDIADFKGKRVAVQKGGVGHFFLLQVLAEAGLSEKDVTIVDVIPDAAASAYQAGDIEIAYSYSPLVEKVNAVQKDGRIIYDSSKMPTAIADSYAFSTQFIQTHPQAVQAFVNSVFKGLDLLRTNPDEALPIVAERLKVKPEELATQLKGLRLPDLQTNIDMLSNPQSELYLPKPMNAMAKFLQGQKQIKTAPDMAKYVDPQFVKALQSKA